jgi:hypothetical protein
LYGNAYEMSFVKNFLRSCYVILTLTGLLKLYSATGHSAILSVKDALLGVSYRTILLAVGALELGVVTFLLGIEDNACKCICIFWLALNFMLYRVGSFWLHTAKLCPCLGSLTDELGLKPSTANWFLEMIVAYMMVGSSFFLTREWQQRRLRKAYRLSVI